MSYAVYICEKCNYRGTTPLICTRCGTKVLYSDKENVYCPRCDRFLHGLEGPCDGCGEYLGPHEFEDKFFKNLLKPHTFRSIKYD